MRAWLWALPAVLLELLAAVSIAWMVPSMPAWLWALSVLLLGLLAALPVALNAAEMRRHRLALRGLRGGFPIVMPVTDRPEYLAQVLAGLRGVADIEQSTLVFTQDERNPEVAALIASCGMRHTHLRHTQPFFGWLARMGLMTRSHCIGSNIFFGIDAVFRHGSSRGVIILEDDLVPSINFYRHFVWCFQHLMHHPQARAPSAELRRL